MGELGAVIQCQKSADTGTQVPVWYGQSNWLHQLSKLVNRDYFPIKTTYGGDSLIENLPFMSFSKRK